ncbi:MAG: alpha-E domain-containing protein [Pseudomonadota bacterium]|nr:alpha-E domain-containing protein [Pseudomonadota bacterium]
MLSRVAQNIYWMARYVERAENTARLVNVNANLLLDLPRNTAFGWEPLIYITGSDELFFQHYETPDEAGVVRFLLGDRRNPGSILSSLAAARENLRTTRDVVPRESWEQINDLYFYVRDFSERGIARRARYDFLKRVILGCQQIAGLLAGTMSRTPAYDFIRLGRYLERADMTTRILDVRSANLLPRQAEELTPFESIQWMSVLRSLSAYQMYRQQVRVRVRGLDVLKFLLQNPLFPRTVCHCLNGLETCLRELPRNAAALDSVRRLGKTIAEAQVRELASAGLHEFIDDLQIGLGEIHERIATTYFARPAEGQSQAQ